MGPLQVGPRAVASSPRRTAGVVDLAERCEYSPDNARSRRPHGQARRKARFDRSVRCRLDRRTDGPGIRTAGTAAGIEAAADLHRRRYPTWNQLFSEGRVRLHQAEDGRRDGLFPLSHVRRGRGLPAPMGGGLPEPDRPLFGRSIVRGTRHLADDDHQQVHGQGHGQAGHVHRRQPAFRRGNGGRVGPLVRLASSAATGPTRRSPSSSTRRPSTSRSRTIPTARRCT